MLSPSLLPASGILKQISWLPVPVRRFCVSFFFALLVSLASSFLSHRRLDPKKVFLIASAVKTRAVAERSVEQRLSSLEDRASWDATIWVRVKGLTK